MLDLLKLMSQLAICWAGEGARGTIGCRGRRHATGKKAARADLTHVGGRGGESWEGRQRDSLPTPSLPPSLLLSLPPSFSPSLPAIKDQLSHHSVFFPLSHTSCILFMAYIFQLYGFIYGGYIYGIWLTALNQLCVSNKSQIYIFLQTYILLGAGD